MTCQFQYTGTMINDLYDLLARVDNTLDLARIKRDAEKALENKKICRHCRFDLGDHSNIGSLCPIQDGWYSTVFTFSEVRCEGPSGMGIFDLECGKECVPGEVYCTEHSREAS